MRKVKLQQLVELKLHCIRQLVCYGHWHGFFFQLFLPFGACQEMLAECCSATCDTSAVIAVTSLSPEQDVMLVKFMQLPAAFDTHS